MLYESKKIGLFISQLRKEKNMTQSELAEKLGVTDRSISRWENGKTFKEFRKFLSRNIKNQFVLNCFFSFIIFIIIILSVSYVYILWELLHTLLRTIC